MLQCTDTDVCVCVCVCARARVCVCLGVGIGSSVAAWPVEQSAGFFRHFRILQTGYNSSETHHLACAGIELYGTFRE